MFPWKQLHWGFPIAFWKTQGPYGSLASHDPTRKIDPEVPRAALLGPRQHFPRRRRTAVRKGMGMMGEYLFFQNREMNLSGFSCQIR